MALYLSLKEACNQEIIKAKDKEIAQLTSELTADNKTLRTAIEYYKDDAVVREAQIERLETEMKEKDVIISTRTEVAHQLQDALMGRSPVKNIDMEGRGKYGRSILRWCDQ